MSEYNKKINDSTLESIEDYYRMLRTKYRSYYAGAISKLTNPNRYAADSSLRSEYALTQEEKDALLLYVPELLNKEDDLSVEQVQVR